MIRPLSLTALLLLSACAHQPGIGPISPATLRTTAPAFARPEQPVAEELSQLSAALAARGPVELTVYFADWCSDSIREVPRLLALTDAIAAATPTSTGPTPVTLTLLNLDHDKTDPAGAAKAANVQRIPTIVVSQHGKELGRIVEHPKISVGADLVAVLRDSQ
jgi:thioredoxin 1